MTNTRANISLRLLGIAAVAGLLAFATMGGVNYTSQTSFCGRCHEMQGMHTGWGQGSHARTHCYECHVDKSLGAHLMAKASGLRQLFVHLTREVNLERVAVEVPSRRCVRCHDMNNLDQFGERIVTAHSKHVAAKLECTHCHLKSGHSRQVFDGFTRESCAECHSRERQENPGPYLKRPPCSRPVAAEIPAEAREL